MCVWWDGLHYIFSLKVCKRYKWKVLCVVFIQKCCLSFKSSLSIWAWNLYVSVCLHVNVGDACSIAVVTAPNRLLVGRLHNSLFITGRTALLFTQLPWSVLHLLDPFYCQYNQINTTGKQTRITDYREWFAGWALELILLIYVWNQDFCVISFSLSLSLSLRNLIFLVSHLFLLGSNEIKWRANWVFCWSLWLLRCFSWEKGPSNHIRLL